MEYNTIYNINDKFYSANYEICQENDGRFIIDYFVKKVEIIEIKIDKNYGQGIGESSITYYVSNGQYFRENENPKKLNLFQDEAEAKKAAKEKAIMKGKSEIRSFESDIEEKQRRIKELKQSLKTI